MKFPGYSRKHPIYEFRYFRENDHSDNGHFREKSIKSYEGRIRKNLKIQ